MENNAKKILVVDDDHIIGEMLKMLLEFSGFEVVFSENTEDIEESIINHNIDLIILDFLISGVKGTVVCANLRKNKKTAHIPILMMSALCDAENVCTTSGANYFIAKPFERKHLLATVDKALNLK